MLVSASGSLQCRFRDVSAAEHPAVASRDSKVLSSESAWEVWNADFLQSMPVRITNDFPRACSRTCTPVFAGKKTLRGKASSAASASRLGPLWTPQYRPLGSLHTPSPGREFTPVSGGEFGGGDEGGQGEGYMEGEGLGKEATGLALYMSRP